MSGFTLGSMYWINPKYTLADFREDLRRVRENRITLLRIFIQWEYVEVEKGKFDFSIYDTFFRAAEEAGIELMPTLLFYLPYHRLAEQERRGESDVGRRYPCLDRPAIREGLERFFAETVRRYKDSPALSIWNVWNEPTDYMCGCPDSLGAFAAWLKRKYPTTAALREAWAGEYSIFSPVLPPSVEALDAAWLAAVLNQRALRGRDTALRLDWFDFQLEHSAEHLAFLVGLVRRDDALTPIHTNPCNVTSNPVWAGISPWLLAREQESTGGSLHPHGMLAPREKDPRRYAEGTLSVIDLIRSWTAGGESWIGEYQAGSTIEKKNAYTPRGSDISATLYHSLARGLRGVIFWEWQSWRAGVFEPGEFSLRNPSDGGPTERSRAAENFGEFLEKHRAELAALPLPRPRVAVLQSMTQCSADTLLDNALPGSGIRRHYDAAYACHQALVKAGFACDFVTESQLEGGGVPEQYRVLIAPQVRLVAPETAAALEGFVRRGGALWADGRCGFLDKHMMLRDTVPCNGLDRVFGCREIDEVAPFEQDRLIRRDGSALKPYREIQRLEPYETAEVLAECNGYPAAVRNRYGAGTAELWGSWIAAEPENDLAAMLTGFAVAHGVEPELRIRRGHDVLASLRRGEELLLAVFTSLAEEVQEVVAELPFAEGKVLNGGVASAVAFAGGELKFAIRPGETLPMLISRAC